MLNIYSVNVAALLQQCRNVLVFIGSLQYLDVARHLVGYGEIAFPHCACDARKDGHVIAIAASTSFKLQACKEDGSPEVRC